jgi:phage tail-like protein
VSDPAYPFSLFRFQVEFRRDKDKEVQLAYAAFAECTGLEATMEPKVFKSGGANYGDFQRAGRVTFGTVILKRGITTNRDLWRWFSHVAEQGKFAYRLSVKITVFKDPDPPPPPGKSTPAAAKPQTGLTVELARALPVKFKCGDLNAKATEVGVEELHLVHEGLTFA